MNVFVKKCKSEQKSKICAIHARRTFPGVAIASEKI